jgi:hypothetical protein
MVNDVALPPAPADERGKIACIYCKRSMSFVQPIKLDGSYQGKQVEVEMPEGGWVCRCGFKTIPGRLMILLGERLREATS